MQQECRDMTQAPAMGPPACPMPPPPARGPPAHKGAHGAEPHGRSLIAMHVAAAPRTPSAVVLFGVDALRTSTCITLPVRTMAPTISLLFPPRIFPFVCIVIDLRWSLLFARAECPCCPPPHSFERCNFLLPLFSSLAPTSFRCFFILLWPTTPPRAAH
nr:hypothetical protein [Pandoravirus belohorizontensis]